MTTRGERLRGYLLARTGGSPGWQSRLVATSGVKRQTISKWTSPSFDRYPDLETLAAIAKALDVPTFEIIAAMDGEVAVALKDPRARAAMREEMESLLDERLGPRQAPRGRSGAA
jgi:transcriptional regulator with XRE-family HTH domain